MKKQKLEVLPIRLYGDSILRQIAKEVEEITPELKIFIQNLVHTMYEKDGLGLAAPQVGLSLRIFSVDTDWVKEDSKPNPMVFINPKFELMEGETIHEEGCISLPNLYEEVKRFDHVIIQAIDINGKPFRYEAFGIAAVAIQHEYDHLDGKLFVDYLSKLKTLMIKTKLKALESTTNAEGENIAKD